MILDDHEIEHKEHILLEEEVLTVRVRLRELLEALVLGQDIVGPAPSNTWMRYCSGRTDRPNDVRQHHKSTSFFVCKLFRAIPFPPNPPEQGEREQHPIL